MKDKIPAIQDALRKQGYPGFATRRIEVETFAPGASAPTKEEAREQWEFLNKDRTSSILVDQESVVLQTTRYPRFEDFLEKLTIALTTVQEHAAPSLMLRLGLRYVDLISPREPRACLGNNAQVLSHMKMQARETMAAKVRWSFS